MLCKGCFFVDGEVDYVLEELMSFNVFSLLFWLIVMGVLVIKIEGCQCSLVYVVQVVVILCVVLDVVQVDLVCFFVKFDWQVVFVCYVEGVYVM